MQSRLTLQMLLHGKGGGKELLTDVFDVFLCYFSLDGAEKDKMEH